MSIGFTLPFSRATGSIGYFEVTRTEISAIEQNIRSLLLTNWGERVMHYNFGCNLREFLFEPAAGDELRQKISDRVRSQFDKWLPYISPDQVDVILPDDDLTIRENTVRVRIEYSIVNRPDFSSVFDAVVTP